MSRVQTLVGVGDLRSVARIVGDRRRVALVSQPAVAELYAETIVDGLQRAGVTCDVVTIGDGEEAKSLATIETLCRRFASSGLLRADAVVALGGGVVGDTAGFAAAVYHRGIDVVQVPTTLLAQVDSAIGGKTGVNLPEGKNLVGAFHMPAAVVVDPETLATLPEREFRSGLGEVAKYALMPQGVNVARVLETRRDDVLAREPAALEDVVRECIAIKQAVVSADPEERTGMRATLNLGHTFAHALETAGGYDLRHGEAVAIGLAFAGQLAYATERIDRSAAARFRDLPASLGLPVDVPDGDALGSDALLALMQRDKKAKGGLTFVLPDDEGVLDTVDDPPASALEHAFRSVGVRG
ncbi:MAG TPA: 3-dehydroquinate synthase [Acidimicrobiia bacterium]|nr:3-dehydroquinate synthase [Acidimicrobiia bacterium]